MLENHHWLHAFSQTHQRLFILTGAGVSTDSGIPGYRDKKAQWKAATPIQGPEFKKSRLVQKRYWARSLVGWKRFGQAEPNTAHRAIASLESLGFLQHLLTQNVDGLHQKAGSRDITDLHGRLDKVICLDCGQRIDRHVLQIKLEALNPQFSSIEAKQTADADAGVEDVDFNAFQLADCEHCGGRLKPDVVFFGENVPSPRVEIAMTQLSKADAMLVAGSSLMVYSGYRFCLKAHELGIPIVAINQGQTRADQLLKHKAHANTGDTLNSLLELYKKRGSQCS